MHCMVICMILPVAEVIYFICDLSPGGIGVTTMNYSAWICTICLKSSCSILTRISTNAYKHGMLTCISPCEKQPQTDNHDPVPMIKISIQICQFGQKKGFTQTELVLVAHILGNGFNQNNNDSNVIMNLSFVLQEPGSVQLTKYVALSTTFWLTLFI